MRSLCSRRGSRQVEWQRVFMIYCSHNEQFVWKRLPSGAMCRIKRMSINTACFNSLNCHLLVLRQAMTIPMLIDVLVGMQIWREDLQS